MKRRAIILAVVILLAATSALLGMWLSASPMDATTRDAIVARLQPLRPMRDSASVEWVWINGPRNALGERAGLCASYRALSDSVAVPAYMRDMAATNLMFPSYVHELTHAAQCDRWGLLGYELRKAFRRAAVEAEAVAEERRAQSILNVGVLE